MEESIRLTILFIISLFILVGGFCVYFIPSIIAYKKRQKYRLIILVINIFFGWTFLGWAGSLIWVALENNNNLKNNNEDKYDNLEKLQKLKESGAITDIEFENEKQKLLK